MRPADHPFIREAAEGTLDPAAFDRWLVEDHHFIELRFWDAVYEGETW